MADEVEQRAKRRLNWIGLALSLPALGLWVWVTVELAKEETFLLLWVPVTLLLGGAAYAIHRFLWRWRGAVVVSALVLHLLLMIICIAIGSGSLDMAVFGSIADFIGFAVDVVRWDIGNFELSKPSTAFGSLLLISSLVFTLLHPVYPTLPSALASSIGFSLFLAITALMMSHAA